MMNGSIRTWRGAAFLAVFGLVAAAHTCACAQRAISIDDAALSDKIELEATALGKGGKVPSIKELGPQFVRQSCEVALPAPARKQMALPALYEARVPSVLMLGQTGPCPRCSRWHLQGTGTAFPITEDGICVSNYHMFKPRTTDEAQAFMVAATSDGTVYPVTEILAASQRDDVMVFRIAAKGLRPIPMLAGTPTGADVALISHPMNSPYTVTRGIVSRRSSSRRGGDDGHAGPQRGDLLSITADYCIGSSGGPVMDICGNVVGMVASTTRVYADEQRRRDPQMVLHNCVPVESILKLVQSSEKR